MKKIILSLICMSILLIGIVSAFDATRAISSTSVTISINTAGTTGFIVDEVMPVGVTPSNIGQGGVYNVGVRTIRWTKSDNSVSTLTYDYSGSGSVSGKITGGDPASEKTITGNTILGTSTPQIKINEFELDPAGDDAGNEWVELYNAELSSVDISGWKIYDVSGSAGLKKTIPASTTILSHGYYVVSGITSFNNDGETIILKNSADVQIDITPQKTDNSNDAKSWQRMPDGSSDWQFVTATKGSSNTLDISFPVISNIQAITTESSATINWNTNEGTTSILYYGIGNLNTQVPNLNHLTSHTEFLSGLDSSTTYTYKIQVCDSSMNCVNSSTQEFTTQEISSTSDDLMVNYVRGKIFIKGVHANAGTNFKVDVTSGPNAGKSYTGTVDDNIPTSLKNKGYFDTLDQVYFNTDSTFRVTLLGYECISGQSTDGVFENGGNGFFVPETNLIFVNCTPLNHAPAFDAIGNKTGNEGELLEFDVTATDADSDIVTITSSTLPSGATFNGQKFSWTPNYNQNGTYFVTFTADDDMLQTNLILKITIENKNQAPIYNVSNPIPDQEIWENSDNQTINLTQYFYDLDNDNLNYTVSGNTNNLLITIINGIARLIPKAFWHGTDSAAFTASDGKSDITSSIIQIKVDAVNYAPTLTVPSTITRDENQLVIINAVANDPDNDTLTWSVSDKFTNHNNGTFSWQTDYTNAGTYNINITVNDGNVSVTKSVIVTINNMNQPPYFTDITPVTMDKDSTKTVTISATDPDGSIKNYIVTSENINQADCSINATGDLIIKGGDNYYGIAHCGINVTDNNTIPGTANAIINITLVNINNHAPVITDYFPKFNPITTEDGTQAFSVNYSDPDGTLNPLSVEWFVNNVSSGTGNNFVYTATGDGIFSIKAVVSDSVHTAEKSWTLTATKYPIVSNFNGNTTNFTGMTDDDLKCVNLVLEKTQFGKITFLDCVDLRNVADLNNYADILKGLAGIDSGKYDVFKNKRAEINFYNLNYNKKPTVNYYSGFSINPPNSDVCQDNVCSELNFVNATKQMNFKVTGFSTFFLGDTRTCTQQHGIICKGFEKCSGSLIDARDTNDCCNSVCVLNIKNGCDKKDTNIEVTIEDPEDGDTFKPGDTIKGKVNIVTTEKDKYDVDFVLYDLTKNKTVEDTDKKVSVSDDKDVSFELVIPEDVDEDNDYAIYAKAENDNCNDDLIEITIEREEHQLEITEFRFPDIISCSETINSEVLLKNLGSEDESVYIEIESSELGISQRSDSFDINSGEKILRTMEIIVPNNAEKKSYDLTVRVVAESGELVKMNKKVSLTTCLVQTSTQTNLPVNENIILTTNNVITAKPAVKSMKVFFNSNLMLVLILITAILALVALIFIVMLYNKRNS